MLINTCCCFNSRLYYMLINTWDVSPKKACGLRAGRLVTLGSRIFQWRWRGAGLVWSHQKSIHRLVVLSLTNLRLIDDIKTFYEKQGISHVTGREDLWETSCLKKKLLRSFAMSKSFIVTIHVFLGSMFVIFFMEAQSFLLSILQKLCWQSR